MSFLLWIEIKLTRGKLNMAVKLRMTRKGNRHNPFYRIVAADERSSRDGKYIELLGTYDPREEPAVVTIKMDRVDYWKSKGAQVSQTVNEIINREIVVQK